MLGEIEGKKIRVWQRVRWLDNITELNGHEFEQILGDSEGHGSQIVKCNLAMNKKNRKKHIKKKKKKRNKHMEAKQCISK